jgi:hypothetical protein
VIESEFIGLIFKGKRRKNYRARGKLFSVIDFDQFISWSTDFATLDYVSLIAYALTVLPDHMNDEDEADQLEVSSGAAGEQVTTGSLTPIIVRDSDTKKDGIQLRYIKYLCLILHHKTELDGLKSKFPFFTVLIEELTSLAKGGGENAIVDFEELLRFLITFPVFIHPLLQMQSAFRRKILGEDFWERTKYRSTFHMSEETKNATNGLLDAINEKEIRLVCWRHSKVLISAQMLLLL